MSTVSAFLAKPDMTAKRIELATDESGNTYTSLQKALECQMIEPVSIDFGDHTLTFWFDEEAFFKADPRVNLMATYLMDSITPADMVLSQFYIGNCVITRFDGETGYETHLPDGVLEVLEEAAKRLQDPAECQEAYSRLVGAFLPH